MRVGVAIAVLSGLLFISVAAIGGPRKVTFEEGRPDQKPIFEVFSSSESGLTLRLRIPYLEVEDFELEGDTFHLLSIPGGGLTGSVGRPAVPAVTRLVSIPPRSGASVRVVGVSRECLEGYDLLPIEPDPEERIEGFALDRASYAAEGFPDSPLVTMGEPAILRDLRVVPVTFRPVRYDPARHLVEVAHRVTVEIEFVGQDLRNAKERTRRVIPSSFDRLYRALVVNYDGPPEGRRIGNGSYLVICPGDSAVIDGLQPLLEWRMRMGYPAVLKTTTDIGDTSAPAIKAYIQDAYENWDVPPEYVCLVGDGGQASIVVPTFFDPFYGGEGDHPYTTLEGDDILSDVHIGRLSVNKLGKLQYVVHKIRQYEMHPYRPGVRDGDWFRRACLIGDPSTSGITCVHVMEWMKERLLRLGYVQVDEFYTEPFDAGFTSSLNNGVGIMAYRGFVGMSGIGNSTIMDLENSEMLPFAVCITCDTGSFVLGTSRSEMFLRTGGLADVKAAIGCVGTATYHTQTRYNNVMMFGIWQGLLYEDVPELGADLTRGKLEVYLNFYEAEPTKAEVYAYWNNLMGDPATRCWTEVPGSLTVAHPETISVGSTSVPVNVADGETGGGVPGACVCLWKDGETHVSGFTDGDGEAELAVDVPTTGLLRITVTKWNYEPFLEDIPVVHVSEHVALNGYTVDDDASGTSAGNGDGNVNPGESIELPVQLKNLGTSVAGAVTAVMRTDDPFCTVTDSVETFGDLGSGETAWSADDFDVEVDCGCPHGRVIRLGLDVHSGEATWRALVDLPVVSFELAYGSHEWSGAGPNGELDPGETAEVSVAVTNTGGAAGAGVTGTLQSLGPYLTVEDAQGAYGTIAEGDTVGNTGDRFGVSASPACFPGYVAACVLALEDAGGARDTVIVGLRVGSGSASDPVGPDGYGYYAFDDTDTGYAYTPVYRWVEIDPGCGGQGVDVGLSDFGFEEDDHAVLDLPFAFTYYGSTFTRVTVSSNGWMAMGACEINECWNTVIPGAGGPNGMMAPFWDDLFQTGSGRVFQWYDEANHRFVVEWSRLRNQYDNAPETFEVLLLDPAREPTPSGDGQILFQYHTVNNVDGLRAYATVGIENPDHSDGLLYTFWNLYPDGALPLASGRAIRFVPVVERERGYLTGEVTNLTGGGTPVEGARVRPLGSGCSLFTTGSGAYLAAVPVDTYTVVVDHPSFAPDTACAIGITRGDTAVVDFGLLDIAGPEILSTTAYPITNDTIGPYVIRTHIEDESEIAEIVFDWSANSGAYEVLPLIPEGDGDYRAEIPGQVYDTRVDYYLYARDIADNDAFEPPRDAGDSTYVFYVVPGVTILEDDMEEAGGWVAGAAGDDATAGLWEWADPNATFSDTTMVQPEDDHTPDPGVYCYITGQSAPGSNQGANDVDGGRTTLLSPVLDLSAYQAASLRYYRWYTNDTGLNPGQDYWQVDVTDDGSRWVPLEHTNVSGRHWVLRAFDLQDCIDFTSGVQVRFVAADLGAGAIVEAGVDDVLVLAFTVPGDFEAPEVTVLDPNGGEEIVGGGATPYEIQWTSDDNVGVTTIHILFSTDGGSTYPDTLASGALSSPWSWDVPDMDNTTCRIKVVCLDAALNEGSDESDGDFEIMSVTGVASARDVPAELALAQNRPNPFNPATVIEFGLPARMEVSVRIFSVEGRRVAVLACGEFEEGYHAVSWFGQDENGVEVSSGIYFCRLETPENVITRKMVLLR